MTNPTHYRDPAEIEAVVCKFERFEYRKEEFTHARHLAVAAWYLTHLSPEQSLERMRAGLIRFTRHHGVTGYHETITRFWLRLVEDFLKKLPQKTSFADRVNELLQRFPTKELLFDYYTRERVMSEAARNAWLEPDLQAVENDPAVSADDTIE